MTDPIIIRAATMHDRIAASDVVRSVVLEFGFSFEPDGADSDLADVPDNYVDAGGVFEVVVERERVVGTIGLWPVDEKTIELRKMYLRPGARGRGIGRTMLDRAMTWARNAGFARMELDTAGALEAATHLYKQAGFRAIDAPVTQSKCSVRLGYDL